MFIIIDIQSKNLNSLNNFIEFLILKNKTLNYIKKIRHLQTKKSFFTVLKSPHVNKTAQEQFEYKLYKKKIKIYSTQIFLFLIFLKKIKINLFSDLNFKIQLIINKKISLKKNKNKLNIDNFFLDNSNIGLRNYLKVLDKYGEIILKIKNNC